MRSSRGRWDGAEWSHDGGAVTEASATALGRAIRSGTLTSRQVVGEHIDILRRRSDLGAVAEDRFDEALAEADAADRMVSDAAAPESLPPLLGVPFTVKESIPVAGMPHTGGLASRRGLRAADDAVAVQRLRAAGAIVVAVTNTAELCLGIESYNPLYGRTRNPYDTSRVAGGSSGGEGAAVGAGGVPFGVGADTGGSIRIPAFFCGVFGHKPTPGLVPSAEQIPSLTRHAGTASDPMETIGPLARRAEDLMPLLRIIADPDAVEAIPDPHAVKFDGRPIVVPDHSTYLRPIAAELSAARDRAARVLADAGGVVQHVSLPGLRRAAQFYLIELRKHAGTSVADLFDLFAESPYDGRLPAWTRAHSLQLKLAIIGDRIAGAVPAAVQRRIAAAGRELAAEIEAAMGDGVLLHPPFPRTAPRHSGTLARPWLFGGASVFNLLALPVTEVPLGLDRRGLPLGIQVAAAAGNDHLTIAAALHLERGVGGWVPPGGRAPIVR
ncbi:amidase [Gordonia caeni]|uniref:Amidase n=2 Tax=Gordonia caeni TaxID=1007097 RepID=A0ABP7PRR8_9ACTN